MTQNNHTIRPRFSDMLTPVQQSGADMFSICPTKSKENITIRAKFTYNDREYSVSTSIPAKYYEGAKKSNHVFSYNPRLLNEKEAGLISYESMIFEKTQEEFYQKFLTEFYNIKLQEKLSNDEYLELIVSYVQSLPYDSKKASLTNFQINYPIETAVDGKGICGDKAFLLAGLLACSGYAVSLLMFESEQHMVVGLPVGKEYGTLNTNYAFIETTIPSLIGMHGESVSATVARPIYPSYVYDIGQGNLQYGLGKEMKAVSNIAKYLENNLLTKSTRRNQHNLTTLLRHNEMVRIYNLIVSGRYSISGIVREIQKSPISDLKKML